MVMSGLFSSGVGLGCSRTPFIVGTARMSGVNPIRICFSLVRGPGQWDAVLKGNEFQGKGNVLYSRYTIGSTLKEGRRGSNRLRYAMVSRFDVRLV